MEHEFKLWSEVSTTAKQNLKPSLPLRDWSALIVDEKIKIIKYMWGLGWLKDTERITEYIFRLNTAYRVKSYGAALFDHGGPHTSYANDYDECCRDAANQDFFQLIKMGDSDVVLEILSMYAAGLIKAYYLKNNNGNPTKTDIHEAYSELDRFCNGINHIFDDFAVDITFTRQGPVPKQELIVDKYVIEPVMLRLAGPYWLPVQEELKDAFIEYHKGTPKSYSNAITHLVSGLQAFLQLKVKGEIGKGDIDDLIRSGLHDAILPQDELSRKVINGLKSTLMEYRSKQSDAHPKKEYANEKSVRLVLNLVAVFIQHAI